MLHVLRVTSVLFAALAFVPTGAHLSSMISKMSLPAEDYLASQRAYDGWNLFAVVIFATLLSTLALCISLYRAGESYVLSLLAFLALAGTQIIFWIWTFPANKATANWTMLPEGWEMIRRQWEFSHAGSALLNLVALVLLTVATVK